MNQIIDPHHSRGVVHTLPEQGVMCSKACRLTTLSLCTALVLMAQVAVCAESTRSPLQETVFVAFDLETTGLSAKKERIIEIAAAKIQHGAIIETRQWLVNPGRPIPPTATRIHGLTDADLKEAPPFQSVYPAFLEFIDGSILVAHNAPFDLRFIAQEARRHRLPFPKEPTVDNLRLARKRYPDAKRHTLSALATHLRIDTGRSHRALDDSLTLASVFIKTIEQLSDATTLEALFQLVDGPLYIERSGTLNSAPAQSTR